MRTVIRIVEVILGLALLAFGINKFWQFMPGFEMQEAGQDFMGALLETGYMMQWVGIMEILIGVLLVVGFWAPLALVMLVPLSLNYVAFHFFLDPENIWPGLGVLIVNIILLFAYLPVFKPILRPKPATAG